MKATITIAKAAKRAGIQPETLRRWEATYGWPKPIRDPNTDARLYDEATVELIQRVADRSRSGVHMDDLFRDGLPCLPAEPSAGSHADLLAQVRLLRSCLRLSHAEYWSETGRRMREAAMARGDQETIESLFRDAEVAERKREVRQMADRIADLERQLLHERTLRMQFMGEAR